MSKRPPAKKAPTPKNKTAKAARRVVIAKALVQQQTPKAIAQAIGISRKTVYEELKAPETQQLIQRWLTPYHNDIAKLIPEAIQAIADSLRPMHKRGKNYEVPTDLIDRLRAVKVLGTVLGWAQGKTDGDADEQSPLRKFKGTMEELLVTFRELTAAGESQKPAA